METMENCMDELITRAARDIVKAKKVVALTGAGMSVESGIATFRGKGGLWEKYEPEVYGHIHTLRTAPEKAWIMLREMEREILKAKPNPGHYALAELEKMGYLSSIITQNVDGLHHEAGNKEIIEFHGNMREVVCMQCGKRLKITKISIEDSPPRCACKGAFKPDAVFFGEAIPHSALTRSQQESRVCGAMLVIGTSAVVTPAAYMPRIASSAGAKLIEINPEETELTPLCDYFIKGSSGKVLPLIVEKIKNEIGNLSVS
jgi:NAD-dependent deacetylase